MKTPDKQWSQQKDKDRNKAERDKLRKQGEQQQAQDQGGPQQGEPAAGQAARHGAQAAARTRPRL